MRPQVHHKSSLENKMGGLDTDIANFRKRKIHEMVRKIPYLAFHAKLVHVTTHILNAVSFATLHHSAPNPHLWALSWPNYFETSGTGCLSDQPNLTITTSAANDSDLHT
jgi:hypothetical protein